jgi:site-specific recombinase XerD
MTTKPTAEEQGWPRKVQPKGCRTFVTVYKRQTATGPGFMVANYADSKKRRFDSYNNEKDALDAAETLAKRLDARDDVVARMTNDEAIEYASAKTRLAPFNVTVDAATAVVAQVLPMLGGNLNKVHEAVLYYVSRHRPTAGKPVPEAVKDFVESRRQDGASVRYVEDLEFRLGKFAEDCTRATNNVTSLDVQQWLNGLKLGKQSRLNYKRVLRTFFEYCRTNGMCQDNPVDGTAEIEPKPNPVCIFAPAEAKKLLAAAAQHYPEFVPSLAVCLFAGLRSSEAERLEWQDVDLAARVINLDAAKTKTANGRTTPISDNLAAWLAPYVSQTGKLWTDTTDNFYRRQQQIAELAGLKWQHNAARHSYISYRLVQLGYDAGRVAGECGNSSTMVNRRYKALIKGNAAGKVAEWFGIVPDPAASNVVPMSAAVTP